MGIPGNGNPVGNGFVQRAIGYHPVRKDEGQASEANHAIEGSVAWGRGRLVNLEGHIATLKSLDTGVQFSCESPSNITFVEPGDEPLAVFRFDIALINRHNNVSFLEVSRVGQEALNRGDRRTM